jgi:hypothetical protein
VKNKSHDVEYSWLLFGGSIFLIYALMTFKDWRRPSIAKTLKYLKINKAIIGEISIGPRGGINLLKMPKYGSTTLVIQIPNFDD